MKANYLASPPLVVAYALAGRMDLDLTTEPIGQDPDGNDVYLRDLWPTSEEIGDDDRRRRSRGELFRGRYAGRLHRRRDLARAADAPEGDLYAWDPSSTYVRRPPYFEGMALEPPGVEDVAGARCLVMLGDSVTTDHISPAGSIKPDSPAGQYLVEHGVERTRLQLVRLAPRQPRGDGARDVRERAAAQPARPRQRGHVDRARAERRGGDRSSRRRERYLAEGTPLIVLAGKEYGSGSSRDWAAKGPKLLGVRAVIAESYERIHRSNLLMMGDPPAPVSATARTPSRSG